MMKVLILCGGNSCRSQMAEGILRHLAAGEAEVYSGGMEALGVNPNAIRAMAAIGMDISHHTSNRSDEFLGRGITHVITVCGEDAEVCPYFPEPVDLTHHAFPDPAHFVGTQEENDAEFARVRDMIWEYLEQWWRDHRPVSA